MQKIDTIVVVIIICAGMLAFVVLYNLTNINITEREKEIATIKVLGFFDREVDAYVYRESIALSIIGTLVGLCLLYTSSTTPPASEAAAAGSMR